jgi:hypothetical protein
VCSSDLSITSFPNYIFGNADARNLVRITINTALVENGVVTAPIKYLNLGNDFTINNEFDYWYLNELVKVNYCGSNAKTIDVIKAKLASTWTKALLECVTTSPTFALSSQSEEVEFYSNIKGYTITQSNSVDHYSISPEPSQYGLSFDPLTGFLSGAAAARSDSPILFTIKGSNAIGDATLNYSVQIN